MSDDLFLARAHLHLGNYQLAINEANASNSRGKELLIARAHVALGNYQVVQSQDPNVKLFVLLGEFMAATSQLQKEAILTKARAVFASQDLGNVVIATMLLSLGSREEALKTVHSGNSIETLALLVEIFLLMNRVDLAAQEVAKMVKKDEYSALTQLCQASVFLAEGGSKVDQAFYIFTELSEKYHSPARTLIGTALCHLHNGKFVEAEPLLLEALVKSPNNPDALANLVSCHFQMQREKDAQRYLQQLKTQHPTHPFVLKHTSLQSVFDNAAVSRSQLLSA